MIYKKIKQKNQMLSLIVCVMLCLSGCQGQSGSETEKESRTDSEQMTEEAPSEEETDKPGNSSGSNENSGQAQPTQPYITEQNSVSVADGGWTQEKLKEKYPNKTVLTWVHDSLECFDSKHVEALNDYLVGQGYDFVICFEMLAGMSENMGSIYINAVNTRIEEGDAPDIICTGTRVSGDLKDESLPGAYRGLEYDWFIALDDYLETEDGQVLWDAFPENYWESLKFNGHYYGLTSNIQYTGETYYVNKELMQRYDITEEMLAGCTIEELGEILQKVKEGEGERCAPLVMRGNKAAMSDYISISEYQSLRNDALVFYKEDEEGQIRNLFEVGAAADWFRAIADYRKQGYLDGGEKWFLYAHTSHEYVNLSDAIKSTILEHFAIEEGADELTPQEYEDAAYDNIAEIVYQTGPLYPQSMSITGVCSQSAHQEEALKALTLAMSDPTFIDLMFYGVEGVDYERIDGYVNEEILDTITARYFSNQFLASPLVREKDKPENYRFDLVNELYLSPQAGRAILNLEGYEEELQTIQDIINERYTGLYLGEFEDVDGTLEELNRKLKEAGIDEIIEEANRQLEQTAF